MIARTGVVAIRKEKKEHLISVSPWLAYLPLLFQSSAVISGTQLSSKCSDSVFQFFFGYSVVVLVSTPFVAC